MLAFIACNNDQTRSAERDRYRDREQDDYNDKSYDDPKERDRGENQRPPNRWTKRDIDAFEAKCLTTLGGDREKAFALCPCLLEKLEKKYVSLADMDDNSSSEEGERLARECMGNNEPAPPTPTDNDYNDRDQNINNTDADYSTGGKWSSKDVKDFVDECVGAAQKKGMEYLDAQSYCDCMQYKMERLYPRIQDASRLTQADLETPEMKKMIKSCLPGN